MIAVDTNVLVYANRPDSRFHKPAKATLRTLSESSATWAIPWPCLHEFYSVVTHPRLYAKPASARIALDQITAWLESPSLVVISEAARHFEVLSRLALRADVRGPMMHDAKIAAICISHGVRELLTLDRDFSRFPEITTRSVIA